MKKKIVVLLIILTICVGGFAAFTIFNGFQSTVPSKGTFIKNYPEMLDQNLIKGDINECDIC